MMKLSSNALIQGGDFGVAQADVVCEEGLGDVGEEVGGRLTAVMSMVCQPG